MTRLSRVTLRPLRTYLYISKNRSRERSTRYYAIGADDGISYRRYLLTGNVAFIIHLGTYHYTEQYRIAIVDQLIWFLFTYDLKSENVYCHVGKVCLFLIWYIYLIVYDTPLPPGDRVQGRNRPIQPPRWRPLVSVSQTCKFAFSTQRTDFVKLALALILCLLILDWNNWPILKLNGKDLVCFIEFYSNLKKNCSVLKLFFIYKILYIRNFLLT